MKSLQFIIGLLFLFSIQAAAYDLEIKGKVLDKNTKDPLIGVNIAVIGTTTGASTDIEGNFVLQIKNEHFDDSLIVSFIGYKEMILPVKRLLDQKNNAVFFLSLKSYGFEEVVIKDKPIVLDDIFFEHNKHNLLPESLPALQKLYEYIDNNPSFKIEISGHTDSTGTDEYNLALSEARAGSVVAWLEEQGIDQRRIIAKGYGEDKPITTNETELGRQQNRRVELKVTSRSFNPITGQVKPNDKKENDKEEEVKQEKPPKPDSKVTQGKALFPPKGKNTTQQKEVKPDGTTKSKGAKDFEEIIETAIEASKIDFHGVVASMNTKELITQKAYGQANMTYNVPNSIQTKFYIGNLAEHFTAVLALRLIEKEKLSFNDPISAYLPNYPNIHTKDKITIGQLLSHTSGLMSEKNIPIGLSEKDGEYQHDTYIRLFATQNLLHPAGTEYAYSALNYYLLAVIIEQITDEDFSTLLQEDIFNKLGMNNTSVFDAASIDKDRASNYVIEKNTFRNALLTNKDFIFGACNIISTVEDLQKWDAALRNYTLINEATTTLLFKENFEKNSLFGQITDKGQVSTTSQDGMSAFYLYGKEQSYIIISNVNDGVKNIQTTILGK